MQFARLSIPRYTWSRHWSEHNFGVIVSCVQGLTDELPAKYRKAFIDADGVSQPVLHEFVCCVRFIYLFFFWADGDRRLKLKKRKSRNVNDCMCAMIVQQYLAQ
jgi:hypothetical protein